MLIISCDIGGCVLLEEYPKKVPYFLWIERFLKVPSLVFQKILALMTQVNIWVFKLLYS